MIDVFSTELNLLVRQWRVRLEAEMLKCGQTITKGLALIHLTDAKEPMFQKELARALFLEEPTVARLLDGLEKKGLVVRNVSPKDRRTNFITVTPKAEMVVKDVRAVIAQVRQEAVGNVPAEKLEIAVDVLKLIQGNIQAKLGEEER